MEMSATSSDRLSVDGRGQTSNVTVFSCIFYKGPNRKLVTPSIYMRKRCGCGSNQYLLELRSISTPVHV